MTTGQGCKAVIKIGEYSPVYEGPADVYYYPENIIEYELADELKHLKEFYDELLVPKEWPTHIRPEKVMTWINGQ